MFNSKLLAAQHMTRWSPSCEGARDLGMGTNRNCQMFAGFWTTVACWLLMVGFRCCWCWLLLIVDWLLLIVVDWCWLLLIFGWFLIDWLIDWLTDLIDWLIDYLIDWFDWLIDCWSIVDVDCCWLLVDCCWFLLIVGWLMLIDVDCC